MANKMVSYSGKKLIAFKTIAIAIGLILGLLVIELVLFAIPPKHQMDNPWYYESGGGVSSSSDLLPFERPSNLMWEGLSRGDMAVLNDDDDPYAQYITFQTDSEGFRNSSEIPTADLIVIGDSFTEAGNIPEEDTYVSLLGKKLNLQTKNLGRSGYTTTSELIVLHSYGIKCQPKTVVWQIAESNDLPEEIQIDEWIKAGKPPYFNFDTLGRMSHFESWKLRSPTIKLILLFRKPHVKDWPFSGDFVDKQGKKHTIRFLLAPEKNQIATGNPGWARMQQAIRYGQDVCQQNDIKLIILLMPMKFQVMNEYVTIDDHILNQISALPKVTAQNGLAGNLDKLCNEIGIPFIDATLALKNATASKQLVYLPFDTHLSAEGHEIIAQLISDFLATDSK